MKKICYQILVQRNKGTEDAPETVREFYRKAIAYNQENLALAVQEAWNGEYSIEDDGLPEPDTQEQRIAQLEEALALLLSGVTE